MWLLALDFRMAPQKVVESPSENPSRVHGDWRGLAGTRERLGRHLAVRIRVNLMPKRDQTRLLWADQVGGEYVNFYRIIETMKSA